MIKLELQDGATRRHPHRCRSRPSRTRWARTPARREIVIEFSPEVASYIREREWHASQVIEEGDAGSIIMRLAVCNDRPLRAWILGFGADARVMAPVALAQDIFDAATGMRRLYVRGERRMQMVSLKAG